MKVLHIITTLDQGGAEAMLEKLVRASHQLSPHVEHSAVSLRELGVIGARLRNAGIEVEALRIRDFRSALTAGLKLARLIRQQPAGTVVQTWLYHADLFGGLIARAVGNNRVVWNVRVEVVRQDFRLMTFVIARLCGLLSSRLPLRIVSCGPSILRSHRGLGYRVDKGVVICNGFEVDRFRSNRAEGQRVRAAFGFGPEHLLVGSVGRLAPQKDFRTMAMAAKLVAGAIPNAHFIWMGRGVDTDAELGQLLRSLGIEERVLRLAPRSDVTAFLNALDVFCLPSRSEGFPNALGEAMACGLACVTTNAGDAAFLLNDSRWVVPTESPADLAETLIRILEMSETQRHELGERNRARIERNFRIETAWKGYLALYEQLARS